MALIPIIELQSKSPVIICFAEPLEVSKFWRPNNNTMVSDFLAAAVNQEPAYDVLRINFHLVELERLIFIRNIGNQDRRVLVC